jgi:glycosyltransferase involved in cell wall biosynthesis
VTERRLLFVTQYFPPVGGSGVQRGAKFVKYLQRMGWHVSVVTIDPSVYPDRDDSLVSETRPARVYEASPVRWMPFAEHLVLRSLPAVSARLREAFRSERPEVVLATSPDLHWLEVVRQARAHRLPLVLDYPDPWTVLPDDFRIFRRPTAVKSKLKWRFAPSAERWCLRRASGAVFATDVMRDEYARTFPESAGRFEAIANGYDEEDFEGVIGEPPDPPSVRVTHVGSFAGRRTPVAAARAVARAAAIRPDLTFELSLVGAGAEEHRLELERELSGVPLRIRGWVPHRDAISEMLASSVLWLDAMVHLRSASTGKIYEYLRAGRPILSLAHPASPAARLVRDLAAGEVVSSEDPDETGPALARLAAAPGLATASVGDLDPLTWRHHASALEFLLERVVR